MGLSGRKVKQRIGNDPRNLSWADDASRFGSNYLAKFGWDPSKGLGASGEGRTSHISVSQKLDMLGVGAAQRGDPNGIAWKQNKDFENLLRRMNADVDCANSIEKVEGFSKAQEPNEREEKGKETKQRKRKRDEQEQESETGGKKTKKKRHKSKMQEDNDIPNAEDSVPILPDKSTERKSVPVPPRHRAHRARAIAAKAICTKSAGHISEILGIAPSPSSSHTPAVSSTPSRPSTPKSSSYSTNESDLEKITTTSSKTVGDYFKEKLKSKKSETVDRGPACYGSLRAGLGSRVGLFDKGG